MASPQGQQPSRTIQLSVTTSRSSGLVLIRILSIRLKNYVIQGVTKGEDPAVGDHQPLKRTRADPDLVNPPEK